MPRSRSGSSSPAFGSHRKYSVSAPASPSGRETPTMSRYKASENIKEQHEEKRALSTGCKDEKPSYMSQTVASLRKRESFNYSGDYDQIRSARRQDRQNRISMRTRSLDSTKRPNSARRQRRLRSLEMISDASSEDDYDDYILDVGADASVDEMEHDYCAGFSDTPMIRRNNSDTNGVEVMDELSALPQSEDDSANELSGIRHSALDAKPFPDTQSFEFSSDDNTIAPQAPRMDSMDVPLTQAVLKHGSSMELHSRQTIGTAESFDSTAAISTSPAKRPISPFATANPETKQETATSPLDHTIPKNIGEIEENSDPVARCVMTMSSSDGYGYGFSGEASRVELRCAPVSAISGTPSSGGVVHISEEKRTDSRRPIDYHEPASIKRGAMLAGIFTGVSLILGVVFSPKR